MAARRLPLPPAADPPRYDDVATNCNDTKPVVAVSLLQPRVAVLLDLPKRWHPLLFALRLLSTWPALWSGLRYALRFLVTDFIRWSGRGQVGRFNEACSAEEGGAGEEDYGYILYGPPAGRGRLSEPWVWNAESRLRITETLLSIIWVAASAYLAFLFTDSLMSRWLLNYSPIATTIRLLTIASTFAFISSWTVFLVGGDQDAELLLPAWIGIATTLTLCYHITQRKINIRKETSATISVFSIASFISMVALLMHLHVSQWEDPDVVYPGEDMPLIGYVISAAEIGGDLVVRILGI